MTRLHMMRMSCVSKRSTKIKMIKMRWRRKTEIGREEKKENQRRRPGCAGVSMCVREPPHTHNTQHTHTHTGQRRPRARANVADSREPVHTAHALCIPQCLPMSAKSRLRVICRSRLGKVNEPVKKERKCQSKKVERAGSTEALSRRHRNIFSRFHRRCGDATISAAISAMGFQTGEKERTKDAIATNRVYCGLTPAV